jgi:TonB family protein
LIPPTAHALDEDAAAIDITVSDPAPAPAPETVPPVADTALLQPDVAPVLKKFVKAFYPPDLLKKGIGGTVTLDLLVNEKGNVDSAVVTTGIHPRLDSSAVKTARSFQFSPAMADSVPVAVWLQFNYRFSYEDIADSLVPYINLSGICLEKGTKMPIADATVSVAFIDSTSDTSLTLPFSQYLTAIGAFKGQQLEAGNLTTTTDSAGAFRFYSLPGCSIQVSVIIPGYEAYVTREKLTSKEELSAKFFIERFSYSEYEVVVYGKVAEKEVSRREISMAEIRRIPGFAGDAIKVIQALPGVARPVMGSGEVVVRGAPTWDSKFLLDGMELPTLYHFGGLKSVYNSLGLESINFYPGGFGTSYGGAIAGIVEIHGREGDRKRRKAQAELSAIDGSVFLEGPVTDSVSVIVSARRSFIGDILRGVLKLFPDQFPFSIYPFYWDYLARTDVHTKKAGHLSLTLFGSRDSMSFIYPQMRFGSEEISEQTDRMGMNTTFHMATLGWELDLSDQWKNSLRYNLTNIHTGFTSGFFKSKQDIWVNHVKEQLSWIPSERLRVNLGADMQYIVDDVTLVMATALGNVVPDVMPDWTFGDVAGFLNAEWKPIDRLTIIPGLRYDYYPELQYDGSLVPAFWEYHLFRNNRGFSGEPSARLTTRYEFLKHHTAKFAIGTYNQTPEPMGQVIHPKWGDPGMPTTKATHYIAGYEWSITDLIDLDAQVYFNKQWDIPLQATSSSLSPGAASQSLYRRGGLGRMYGLEMMLRHKQGERFFGWVTYTLARSERFNPDSSRWELFSSDETHNLQLLGTLKLKRDWEAGGRLRFVTGKPTTPVIGVREIENESGESSYRKLYGPENSTRNAPFFQLDIRIDKKIVFDKFIFSLFIDLQNLSWLVYKSPEIEIYSYDLSEKILFSNFPMYTLGFKVEY